MTAIDFAARPLDVARRATLRLATRSHFLTRILARRDSRIAVLAAIQIVLLFALSVRFPVALFFLGPVLLGTVHLAADVRYLVLRRSVPRTLLATSVVAALAITAVRVAVETHVLRNAVAERVDVAIGTAWVGFALLGSLRAAPRVLALPILIVVGALLVRHAHAVEISLVHLHNVIAVVVWLVLFRPISRWTALPLVLLVLFGTALLSGVTLPWTVAHGGDIAFGMHAENLARWLAPGWSLETALALTAGFVFLQGVHYATWIGWIPQEDLPGQGTPTFRMTLRSLIHDFGSVGLAVIVAIALALIGIALRDVRTSLVWYMTLAKSHAWFEGALVVHFLASGKRMRARAG